MMQVPRACSVAAGTAVGSVLGHKWSQLAGPRSPGWLRRTRTPVLRRGGHDLGEDPGGSLSVQVEALVQADAPAKPGGSFPVSGRGAEPCARRQGVRLPFKAASATSNSASARSVTHRVQPRRNVAKRSRARAASTRAPPSPRSHAILNATATALVFRFCGREPEDHHAVAAPPQDPRSAEVIRLATSP
jgi:hypothetical protein